MALAASDGPPFAGMIGFGFPGLLIIIVPNNNTQKSNGES
jgi:hypothetical protein